MPEIAISERNWMGEPPAKKDVSNLRRELLGARAAKCARAMAWLPQVKSSPYYSQRLLELDNKLQLVFAAVDSAPGRNCFALNDDRWLSENLGLLRSALAALTEAKDGLTRTAYVRYSSQIVPRVLIIAEDLLESLEYSFDDLGFSIYLQAFQSVVALPLDELGSIIPALQCVLLERIVGLTDLPLTNAAKSSRVNNPSDVEVCIRSLREINQAPWQEILEPLIVFDAVLRRDPAEAYAHMDLESREMYRKAVVKLAKQSGHSELEIAELVLSLAIESKGVRETNEVLALRRAHVGYYLIAEGLEVLRQRANVRPSVRERWQRFMRRYPDDFYLGGIEILTLSIIVVALVSADFNSLWAMLFATLAFLLPCSECAGQLMNYLISSLLQPQALPKIDFRDGVPEDCTTMVVVPTLLLDEKQVKQLVSDLEVRYLGNKSKNLYFALLTDLPDSGEQPHTDDPIVELCGKLIRELNKKYVGKGAGIFSMFHRDRVYNAPEGVWMGWERKRGKLLDFNRLILGQYDSFPYKVGDLSVLSRVRYVLTVDADTELPHGSAQRLIGTLAHPLCRAVIDDRNVVVQGYGILQPRVAVSVESASQSRLASIYSGSSGFDIYTHATSDVYQDLYGEGTFVGKGLYDLRTVHQVLDHRFPRNAILSHDLIEGAYARAGLVSDVEVIDRYPSHYSTYTRRKHRWVRGDWQIAEWLFLSVPNESGRRVPNPISLISRWKIVDNLRRSMVGPATLVLLVLGWLVLPGQPLYWTAFALSMLTAPPVLQFAVAALRAMFARNVSGVSEAFASLATTLIGILLVVAFLVHDTLVSLDAIIRSLYRRAISRQRLLEWESAAEAELGVRKRTSLDLYLYWTPVIALAIGATLLWVRPKAFWVALPLLALWAGSRQLAIWLDRPLRNGNGTIAARDNVFLRLVALRTWRFFSEFCTPEHHWLIPDSVQENPTKVAARISPTNLGFLLNARQIACELGHLTVPEFVEQTRRTLKTMSQLRRSRGHFLNWYETRTLLPESPIFISSVDSGNLAASLITLKAGSECLLEKPLLSPSLVEGYDDHLQLLAESMPRPSRKLRSLREQEKSRSWTERLVALASEPVSRVKPISNAPWIASQVDLRKERVREIFVAYTPWLLPEFESLRRYFGSELSLENLPPLGELPAFILQLQAKLLRDVARVAVSEVEGEERKRLLTLLPDAYEHAGSLVRSLRSIANDAEHWLADMDFSFLMDRRRKLLSVGYHLDTETLDPSCYDLLASEARIAAFLAIGKGDVPQDTWFRLGRTHVPTNGGSPTLVSWAGTMFEYLMPAIWMRSQGNSLLRRSMQGAVASQKAYAAEKHIPWGISEAGYNETDESGMYRYAAMGVPELSLRDRLPERLVIAPYASAMSLAVVPEDAIENLRRMAELGWLRDYGFYEAADYGAIDRTHPDNPSLVKAWMSHHQGMILLSIGNLLCDNIVQQWFHSDARVRATELILHERPVLQDIRPTRSRRTPGVVRRANDADRDKLAIAS